jgi:hypothetical protein
MDVAEKNFNTHKTAYYSHENAYPYNRNDDPHTDVSLTSLNLFCECTDTLLCVARSGGSISQIRISSSRTARVCSRKTR